MFNSFLSSSVSLNESLISNEEFEAIPLKECYDDPLDACMRIMYETNENFNRITKALAMDELKYFQENGVEYVYEAKDGKNIFQKFAEWIKNIWSKIQGVIKSFIEKIQDKNVANWLNKNKDAIASLGSTAKVSDGYKEYEYYDNPFNPGPELRNAMNKACKSIYGVDYNYLTKAGIIAVTQNKEMLEKLTNIHNQSRKEVASAIMAEILKSAKGEENASSDLNNINLEAFSKKCINIFRSSKKKEVATIDVTKRVEEIKGFRESMKSAKKLYTDEAGFFKTMLNDAKEIETHFKDEEAKAKKQGEKGTYNAHMSIAEIAMAITKSIILINSSMTRANLYAIKQKQAQNIAAIKSALRAAGKGTDAAGEKQQTATGESANFFFNNLELL